MSVNVTANTAQQTWWEIADLIDNDHAGPATVTVNGERVVMSEAQWQHAYDEASVHLERALWADILEDEMSTDLH